MLVVLEAGDGGGLREAIDVERLPRLLQHLDQLWPRDAITDAQTRESLDLKRAEERAFGRPGRSATCPAAIVEVFEIRFVEQRRRFRHTRSMKPIDLVLRRACRSGCSDSMKESRVFGVMTADYVLEIVPQIGASGLRSCARRKRPRSACRR